MKEKKKKRFRFIRMQTTIAGFLVLTAALCMMQRNVRYQQQERILEPVAQEAFSPVTTQQAPECLLLWEDDANGQDGRELMEAVLGQMKIPYESREGGPDAAENIDQYDTLVLSMTHMEYLGESVLDILDWVQAGGGLMILYPPEVSGVFQLMAQRLGVTSMDDTMAVVEGVHFLRPFMLGGQERDYMITDPFESSLAVQLRDDCTVYMESTGESPVPLIWSREVGQGEIVVMNLGFLTKDYRGFYSSAYSLLGDVCVWPVINGSTFYLDDFPSPVPGGVSTYIEADYHMTIEEFYTQVWWNDIYNLADQYGIRYTGLVIEDYSDLVEAPFPRPKDLQRYRYFGNMLLNQGGEIGYHGYNHMPLCLPGFDYEGGYESYNLWNSYEDMKASIEELHDFCQMLFPTERFRVYVPPSNILSDEGRQMLGSEFPDLTAIASVYLPGDVAYVQEFEVAEDGIIETPRIISGYILEEDMYVSALSELNFHFVNTHFQHPDDVLDEDRGAELGWEEMFGRLEKYMEWLYGSAGSIRNLTGTELAGAVQVYDSLEVLRQETDTSLKLVLEGFHDQAWLMVRINEGTPGQVQGGQLTRLQEGLYLLQADSPEVEIALEK